uniref:mitochondrial fission 1 protein A-like isoform X2 n=1 Tax=Erigeron canadensis TaxID=72917 RepID=UPI001CB90243|nr:mitochondrial fission 1 protein A-like isoform X2 [Erigeron canadensis]
MEVVGKFHMIKETVSWYLLPLRTDNALPCYDHAYVSGYESEFDVVAIGERRDRVRKILLRALVHSEQPEDVFCAMTMLQGLLLSASNNPKKRRKALYLLAIGYYKRGNYLKCRDLVYDCLEIAPCWLKALNLKLLSEDRINKEAIKDKLIDAVTIVGAVSSLLGHTSLFSWVSEALAFMNLIKDRVKGVPALLPETSNLLQVKEEICSLADRYYTRGNYLRSRLIIDHCLEIDPEWKPAIKLKEILESAERPAITVKQSNEYGEAIGLWICIAIGVGVVALSRRRR